MTPPFNRILTRAETSVSTLRETRDRQRLYAGWLAVETAGKRSFRWRYCVLDGVVFCVYRDTVAMNDVASSAVTQPIYRRHILVHVARLHCINRGILLIDTTGYGVWVHATHEQHYFEEWLAAFRAGLAHEPFKLSVSRLGVRHQDSDLSSDDMTSLAAWLLVRKTVLRGKLRLFAQTMFFTLTGRRLAGFKINMEGRWADLFGKVFLKQLTDPALKRLYKFVLKRLIGRFLADDEIDLDQLDVHLRSGRLELCDLMLSAEMLNAEWMFHLSEILLVEYPVPIIPLDSAGMSDEDFYDAFKQFENGKYDVVKLAVPPKTIFTKLFVSLYDVVVDYAPPGLPSGVVLVLGNAYDSISRELHVAAKTIVAVPLVEYKKTGSQGYVRSVIRAVPVAVLRPMIGASEAVSKALIGVRNAVDPELKEDVENKFKDFRTI
ncbi:hypothetical protein P43SY_006583 [Pythium insidiosum]|uniref:Autophagy-related protein 2 n=1 Tax=Pythium insidiosum TaxID=114742 RepID=A0AAD5Q978_PYTIN|nr:hypothetical protein P43SY_006583 [Pythium insidiosum]